MTDLAAAIGADVDAQESDVDVVECDRGGGGHPFRYIAHCLVARQGGRAGRGVELRELLQPERSFSLQPSLQRGQMAGEPIAWRGMHDRHTVHDGLQG